ncbi:Zn(2)-C6 fungal-type DNA-binding domain [Phaffia rhodozyma]|uniref:Zn(2)-C6 fungal-type DNA-binding domain n=1 Tax=Phaffia rhodozyma TaxID=264483 RepID=A0A0F7SR95_PHARH|nr:Zn(2)-C6 fungal-type DNA-binding domain [Phaffia rhodozyma]
MDHPPTQESSFHIAAGHLDFNRPTDPETQAERDKAKRAYRACTNCRTRKARCDLGDVNYPKDPPCARCKRESKECTFLPSRRGGNLTTKARAKSFGSHRPSPPMNPVEPSGLASTSHLPQMSLSSTTESPSAKRQRRISFSSSDSINRPEESRSPTINPIHPSTSIFPAYSKSTSISVHPSLNEYAYPQLRSPASSTNFPLGFESQYSMMSSHESPRNQHQGRAHPAIRSSSTETLNTVSSNSGMGSVYGPNAPPRQPSYTRVPNTGTSQTSPSSSGYSRPPSDRPDMSSIPSPQPRYLQSSRSIYAPVLSPSQSTLQPHGGHDRTHSISSSSADMQPSASVMGEARTDQENFITGGMANEVDALSLLARTATGKPTSSKSEPGTASEGKDREGLLNTTGSESGRGIEQDRSAKRERDDHLGGQRGEENLADDEFVCDLVKRGCLDWESIKVYVDQFFSRHHQIFPMVPSSRIPKTSSQLRVFAKEEKQLLATVVCIASRYDTSRPEIHRLVWEVISEYIVDTVIYGRDACVGFVESMLLLSENVPRPSIGKDDQGSKQWDESTQSWYLVGHAVRTGYLLGLDQKTMNISTTEDSTPSIERDRLAWTYCYIFDRHISLRIGKAFWSRGPGLCFTENIASINFPSLRPIPSEQDDFASVVQALVELTQTMTAAHDVLYPSHDRTMSLVRAGEYYKYLDEFSRSINAFHSVWLHVKFSTFPCDEIVWCTFHYIRLYIYVFAFQAHVQRAVSKGGAVHFGPDGNIFPRGPLASPDSKFIMESIDAARQLLMLCTERLHPGGALPFLPARFFLWFTYASVFLLKAIYSNAILRSDTRNILELIQKVIFCLANSSPDKSHLGIRHALLLRTVAKKLRQSFSDESWVAHTGTATPLFAELPDRFRSAGRSNRSPPISTSGADGPSSFVFNSSNTPSTYLADPSMSTTQYAEFSSATPGMSASGMAFESKARGTAWDFTHMSEEGNGSIYGSEVNFGMEELAYLSQLSDLDLSSEMFWTQLVPMQQPEGSGIPFR